MAHNAILKNWRHTKTGERISGGMEPPNVFEWVEVQLNIETGNWEEITEPTPTPETEDERLANVPIKGYRQLTALELELTNRVKEHADATRILITDLETMAKKPDVFVGLELDQRWVAIARTNLQQGYMALVRSITRPKTF